MTDACLLRAALLLLRCADGYEDEPEGAELMLGGRALTVHASNADDPYVTVPDHEDFDEEDDEDLAVKPTDVLIAVGRTEDEASVVELYLYEEEGNKLYVHHDFNLPSFPLTMCWLDCDPRSATPAESSASSSPAAAVPAAPAKGSFLAVGTFHCGIELWNLDVLDVLEPVATLGGRHDPDPELIKRIAEEEAAKAKKKGKKGAKAALDAGVQAKLMGELKEGSHADAVMSLAWHPASRTRLASGSADKTVKLWDVSTQKCTHTFSALHKDKVQTIGWNVAEPNILLSGSYDQTCAVADVRADLRDGKQGVLRFALGADVEQARWSPHHPFLFAAALENGHVLFFDARAASSGNTSPLFTLAAHNAPCTSLSFNSVLPTTFATASLDKTVKVWDFNPSPHLVSSKEMKAAGGLFTAHFDVNYAHVLAAGGDKGKLAVWDLREDAKLRAKYGEECDGRLAKGATAPIAFTMPTPGAAAGQAASSSSSAANAEGEKKKKNKKNKMKTSTRRQREDNE